jgi:nitroreductase
MSRLKKNVWDISHDEFPRSAPIESQLHFLLRYAILAPSTKNSQPWRFLVEGNVVQLIAALERRQPIADPEERELYISLGCALENLLVAAERFGFHYGLQYLPERRHPELAAIVHFAAGGAPSPERRRISLDSILARHNDNSVYRDAPVPQHLRSRLQACCVEPELRVDLTDDQRFLGWIEELTLEADRLEFANPAFRKELGYWIGQGVFGTPQPLARLGGFAVSRMDLGEPVARQDREIVESAALLGVISAVNDSHLIHLRTGQLFERIWLTATAAGVSVHPMSQTMRSPAMRKAVGELLHNPGWIPQHLFRVGYSSREEDEARHTPRRPLKDVIEA